MSNNNQQMKAELVSTIQKMIENNPVLRMKIIANKESKSGFATEYSLPMIFFAIIAFILGFTSIYSFITDNVTYPEKTLLGYLLCLWPFGLGFAFYFFRNSRFVRSENIDQYVVRNFFDNKDYQLFYNAGSSKDKEVLEFYQYLNSNITYNEIGL